MEHPCILHNLHLKLVKLWKYKKLTYNEFFNNITSFRIKIFRMRIRHLLQFYAQRLYCHYIFAGKLRRPRICIVTSMLRMCDSCIRD